MRLLATMARKTGRGDRLRQTAAAAVSRGRRADEGRVILAELRLPASSMLKTADNRNLSLNEEDLAG